MDDIVVYSEWGTYSISSDGKLTISIINDSENTGAISYTYQSYSITNDTLTLNHNKTEILTLTRNK